MSWATAAPPRLDQVVSAVDDEPVDRNETPRLADVGDAGQVGRLLHEFNTEFETPAPGANVLTERLPTLLAGASMFAILVGSPAFAVALVSIRPNVWYPGRVGLLDELYVHPHHRDKGFGSAIMRFLQHHALTIGIDARQFGGQVVSDEHAPTVG